MWSTLTLSSQFLLVYFCNEAFSVKIFYFQEGTDIYFAITNNHAVPITSSKIYNDE